MDGGWSIFLRCWLPTTMWVGPLMFSSSTTNYVWIITSLHVLDYLLSMEHISCVIANCGQHQWVSLAGGKHDQKITVLIIIFFLQKFGLPGCFPYILFYCYLFSLLWLVCHCLCQTAKVMFSSLLVYWFFSFVDIEPSKVINFPLYIIFMKIPI